MAEKNNRHRYRLKQRYKDMFCEKHVNYKCILKGVMALKIKAFFADLDWDSHPTEQARRNTFSRSTSKRFLLTYCSFENWR